MGNKYLFIFLLLTYACKPEVDKRKSIEQPIEIIKNVEPKNSIPDYINQAFITGAFDPAGHPEFVTIDSKYSDRNDRLMHKEAYASFIDMHAEAKSAGINLNIISATRNFNYQKNIWHRKWRGKTLLEGKYNAAKVFDNDLDRARAIMRFSSMPGTSRHHWGTDIDINNFNNDYFASGKGLKEFEWLKTNAAKFGFYQVYTDKEHAERTGYEEEKWHWSYMPIAKHCLAVAKKDLNNSDIKGFDGAESAKNLDVKKNYIFGIDKSCL